MSIQLPKLTLPDKFYVYTVEDFFYFNKLYKIREVVLMGDNNIHEVADHHGSIRARGMAMRGSDILVFVFSLLDKDDWVDLVLKSGTARNIQRLR